MIDLTNDEASTSPELVPAGTYPVRATTGIVKPTKDGSGTYLETELIITGGDWEGRKVWHRFNLTNRNETATKIGRGQLKAFLTAANHADPNHLAEAQHIVGLQCLAKVTVKTDATYGDKNEVKGFTPFAEGDSTTTAKTGTEFAHAASFP